MSTNKSLLICLFWCFLTLPKTTISGQSITNLQANQVSKATSEDIFKFEHIIRTQNGIKGHYHSDLYLGSAINSNGRVFLGKKWFIWSNQPETFCGLLETFGSRREKLFALLERGQEMDWVLRMKPGIGFEHLIAHTYHKNLLSAEVSPHKSLLENPWFEFDAKKSSLLNSNICACGVYARDKEHDKYGPKMEIHPTHMFWWKDSTNVDTEIYQMIAIQDNSNRFNRGYYRPGMGKAIKGKVKSWVESPLLTRFSIAFLLSPEKTADNPLSLYLSSQKSRGINSRTLSKKRTGDALHYQGKQLLVVEKSDSLQGVEINFSNISLREDGFLQGFIEISASIGKQGDYGNYHVFQARSDQPLIQEAPVNTPCFEESYLFWVRSEQVASLTGLITETESAIVTSKGKVKKALQKQSFLLNEKRKIISAEVHAAEDKLLECIEQ